MMECVTSVYGVMAQAKPEKMTRISATIPEPVAEQFKELCKKQRRSVSAQLTLLMEQAILGVEGDAVN